ncbi:ATP-binding protein [Streptacidiphilus monticola]|uniref:ATP-binding protein n=1 Tax=Streptacidiphilus monticola TaxID=2161674 RepID=A0ABW1GAC3_9ACTN
MGLDPLPQAVPVGGGFRFVGRRRELALLRAAIEHPPAVVLVEGEAGIGKSRLVREATAGLPGPPVLTGFCHPLREPFPFGPVVDALRKAGPLLPPADAIAPSAGALVPLLPDLADRLPPRLPRPDDPGSARQQLVLAVRSFLTALGPAVVVIEDLHWADEATRELILLLNRDLPQQLALVVTYRADDMPAGAPPLGSAYRRSPGAAGVRIHLEPLSEQDVRELARDALGEDAGSALVGVLYQRSEGLPLIAEEDLLTVTEHSHHPSGQADLATRLEHAEIPGSLREAVTERLAALSERGAAVAAAAAVLAVPAPEPLISQVAGLTADGGAEGLTEALGAALLQETAGHRYVYRHVLAQQAAYQYLPGPQRRRLHHRALEALQAQQPPPLVQIAHHTLALGNRDAWLPQAQAAADQAVELGDHGTAAALLHQILDTPELQPEPRSRAALTLARIAVNGVDLAGNAAALRRILADPHLPATTRGDIRLSLGLLMVNHGSDRTGHGEIERAVRELRHCPERAARGMVALAMNERGDSADQAWTWLERAEETVRDGPYEAMRATVRATRLSLLAREADPDVWPFLDDLPRRADDPEVLRQTARALYNVGELAVETGHDRRGRALLTEAQALARDAGIPHLECYSRIALLRLDGLAGHWAELERDFALLIDEYPDIGMAREERALAGARLAIARGRQARALEWLQEAADFGARGTQVTVSCRAAAETAALRLAQDAPAAAWGAALAAVTDLRGARAWPRATGLLPVAVESALACADRDAAEQLADEAEQQLKGRDAPGATAELHCARGLLLEAADPAGAAEQFAHARCDWDAIGRPYESARAAERQGRALAGSRPEESAEPLGQAVRTFEHLGATADAARCQRTLRELGLRAPASRGRRSYGSELSPRELQVAELLARGATNRDIAEALFLSPRTVEQHVAHVLKKLDVPRRHVKSALAHHAPPKGREELRE